MDSFLDPSSKQELLLLMRLLNGRLGTLLLGGLATGSLSHTLAIGRALLLGQQPGNSGAAQPVAAAAKGDSTVAAQTAAAAAAGNVSTATAAAAAAPAVGFCCLPLPLRTAILQSWSLSSLPQLRKAFKGLKAFVMSRCFSMTNRHTSHTHAHKYIARKFAPDGCGGESAADECTLALHPPSSLTTSLRPPQHPNPLTPHPCPSLLPRAAGQAACLRALTAAAAVPTLCGRLWATLGPTCQTAAPRHPQRWPQRRCWPQP